MSSERLTEVRVVDDGGGVVCVLVWDAGGEVPDVLPSLIPISGLTTLPGADEFPPPVTVEPQWRAQYKPESAKSRRHSDAQAAETGFAMTPAAAQSPHPLKYRDGQPARLELPGLTLRWEKVTAALDALANNVSGQQSLTLTVNQMRQYVG